MNNMFLERVARYLYSNYGERISEVCIVVPNRRAGLFFQKYLGTEAGKTIWSPAIFSIEDFLTHLSGLRICDSAQVLFELYEIHKSLEGLKAQAFDEFTNWAQQLLNDFNEIDSYLVDAKALFSYLSEAKAISIWNPDNKPLTDFEKQYLRFYNSLSTYHQLLGERLLAQNLAYTGLLFRRAAERVKSHPEKIKWRNIIFTGFNALTKSEEIIIDSLIKEGKAETIWDSDEYYMQDDRQEAGFFLRHWKNKWKNEPFNWISKNFAESSALITTIGVPYLAGQAKLCGELLSDPSFTGKSAEKTAVVMLDEQALLPVLNSLPRDIKEFNITMGLPLRQTPVYDLIGNLFRMHENVTRFDQNGKHEKFYYRDVLRVLQHPYITGMAEGLLDGNTLIIEDLIAQIRTGSRIFLTGADITGAGSGSSAGGLQFLGPAFADWKDPQETIGHLQLITEHLRDGIISRKPERISTAGKVELEFLYAFSKITHRLSTLVQKFDAIKTTKVLHSVFNQLAGITSLPFYGEPLKGIQIMGMLETRTLDFDNLILLSVNEDLIPSGKTSQSFIPFDIRRHYHLPTYQHKNSIYAYHFYRLIQRAKRAYILYNTESDELGGGEKSRFIKQIQNELRNYNPAIRIEDQILVTSPLKPKPNEPILVPKDPEVMELLEKKAESGFSATALNNYIQCPVKFYLHDLLGIREDRVFEETITADVMGKAIHQTLEQLFLPHQGKELAEAEIDLMFTQFPDMLNDAYRKNFRTDISNGRNLLLVRVSGILVRKFLEKQKEWIRDAEQLGFRIVVKFLERTIEDYISVQTEVKQLNIKIKGVIDRIDLEGREWSIMDYKTGSIKSSSLRFDDWNELVQNPELSRILQLYLYAWLLRQSLKDDTKCIRAGILSLRKLNQGILHVRPPDCPNNHNNRISEDDLKNFEVVLKDALAEVFNSKVPFSQTGDIKRCPNCDFVSYCQR